MIPTEFLDSCYKAMMQQEQSIPRVMDRIPKGEEERLDDARQVVLTGAGDSLAVAEYGARLFQEIGVHAIAVTPTVVGRLSMTADDLLVGITASGRSLSTISALEYAKRHEVTTVALTDNPEGRASDTADVLWDTESGVDTYDIIPTAPTTAAMGLLLGLGSRLDGRFESSIKRLLDSLQSIMDWAESAGKAIARKINRDGVVCLISEGVNLTAARMGMMKLNEGALVRGVVVLREEFQHHGNLPARKEDFVILISDTPIAEKDSRYMQILTDSLDLSAYHQHVPERFRIEDPAVQVVGNTIAMQMMGYYLILEHNPEMEWFRMPNAKAFRIY